MFFAFIILCVALVVIDEARTKSLDLKGLRDKLNAVEE